MKVVLVSNTLVSNHDEMWERLRLGKYDEVRVRPWNSGWVTDRSDDFDNCYATFVTEVKNSIDINATQR